MTQFQWKHTLTCIQTHTHIYIILYLVIVGNICLESSHLERWFTNFSSLCNVIGKVHLPCVHRYSINFSNWDKWDENHLNYIHTSKLLANMKVSMARNGEAINPMNDIVQYFMYFLPEASIGLRVFSLPTSVRPSVSPSVTKFVRAITHHPFKLGSPNCDHRRKRPWSRSLLCLEVIDHDLQG